MLQVLRLMQATSCAVCTALFVMRLNVKSVIHCSLCVGQVHGSVGVPMGKANKLAADS